MLRVVLVVLMFASFQMFVQGAPEKDKPDEKISVNKEYDENGDLIRFDSTYVRSWSSDSTFASMDIDSIRKEMELLWGKEAKDYFSDSTLLGSDMFHNFDEHFFQQHLDLLNQLGQSYNDSTIKSLLEFADPFSGFEEMHREMMSHLKEFFNDDSIPQNFGGISLNDSLVSPDEDDMDRLRKEIELYFDQLNKQKAPKKKGS